MSAATLAGGLKRSAKARSMSVFPEGDMRYRNATARHQQVPSAWSYWRC